jgi:hypothetical protein
MNVRIGVNLQALLAPGWPRFARAASDALDELPVEVRSELLVSPPSVRLVDSDSEMGVDVALLTTAGDLLCLVPYGALAARPPDADVFDEEIEQMVRL